MGLRERYLAAMQAPPLLHVAPLRPVQHATHVVLDATRRATGAQRGSDLQGIVGATLDATVLQQPLASDATGAQRALQPEALDLAAAWTDAEISAFLDRRARLLRWGWPEAEAEKLAERLVRRDREADDRVSCTDCAHYRLGRCGNNRCAGLQSPEVGRDLASMLQRCPAFDPLRLIVDKAEREQRGNE